jgi:hypothetical protein
MNVKLGACGLILGAAILAGCDKKPEQPAATGRPPANYNEMMEQGAKAQREAAAKAAEAAKQRMTAATNTAATAVKDAANSDAAANAKAVAGDAMDKVKAQGNDLLAKLESAIRSNKLDEGQTYVDALEKIKEAVPAEVKAKYEALKTQLATAKAKAAEPNK